MTQLFHLIYRYLIKRDMYHKKGVLCSCVEGMTEVILNL